MGANNFIALSPILPGASTGPQPAIDLFALVSATGLNPGFTVICSGDFEGTITIEGSLNGVSFAPVGVDPVASGNLGVTGASTGGFTLGKASNVQPTTPTYELSPIIVVDVVRYLRVNVAPGTLIRSPIKITIGGAQNCECGAGGGGGGAVVFTDTVRSNPTDVDGNMQLDLFPSQFNASSILGTNAGAVTLSNFRLTLTSWNADAGTNGVFEIVTAPYGAFGPALVIAFSLPIGALTGNGSQVLISDVVTTVPIAANRRWWARIRWAGGVTGPDSGAAVDCSATFSMAPT